ncbi:MAG: hypothetical protein V1717_03920 [Candidatus Micrarchaeota archaeon]
MKRIALIGLILAVSLAFAYTPNYGMHSGEQNDLAYSIEYLAPSLFVDYPDDGYYHLAGYYIGTTMHYKITLTNAAKRTFKNLRVIGVQEYLQGGLVQGQSWNEDAMQNVLSNGIGQTFYVPELRPAQSVELTGSFYIPLNALPGVDRTRLIVLHMQNENANEANGGTGRVIVNDAFAGVYCPPPN